MLFAHLDCLPSKSDARTWLQHHISHSVDVPRNAAWLASKDQPNDTCCIAGVRRTAADRDHHTREGACRAPRRRSPCSRSRRERDSPTRGPGAWDRGGSGSHEVQHLPRRAAGLLAISGMTRSQPTCGLWCRCGCSRNSGYLPEPCRHRAGRRTRRLKTKRAISKVKLRLNSPLTGRAGRQQ
jgi:hypothetical protein